MAVHPDEIFLLYSLQLRLKLNRLQGRGWLYLLGKMKWNYSVTWKMPKLTPGTKMAHSSLYHGLSVTLLKRPGFFKSPMLWNPTVGCSFAWHQTTLGVQTAQLSCWLKVWIFLPSIPLLFRALLCAGPFTHAILCPICFALELAMEIASAIYKWRF